MEKCLSKYVPFWDRSIEMMVLPHPQKDHYGGLLNVIESFEVGLFLSAHPGQFRDVFSDVGLSDNTRILFVNRGQRVQLGDMMWEVVWPDKHNLSGEYYWQTLLNADIPEVDESDVNLSSVVMRLQYQNLEVWFTGDIDTSVEEILSSSVDKLRNIRIVKVAHHGSKTSSGDKFLEVVEPQIALISVGKNNYGHPSSVVLDAFDDIGTNIYRTDEWGSVEVVSDGDSVWVVK